jgi:response regulator RpfG family c-di-GMP phosphodiesterase
MTKVTHTPTVLYLDDSAPNRQAFQAAFRKEFKVLLAATAEEAMNLLAKDLVHVLIADQRMPGLPGSEVLRLVKQRHPAVRRMLVTAYADLQAIVDALNHGGVCYYIQKPWEEESVRRAVAEAFAEFQAEEERSAFTARLIESNRQLEFALRQRLLS